MSYLKLSLLWGALVGVAPVFAVVPAGPDSYRVAIDTDTSYVAEGFAVPATAAGANIRHGAFLPEGGVGHEALVWKNTKLSDIESFSAKIRYFDSRNLNVWKDATTYHTRSISDSEVECQFQAQYLTTSDVIFGFVMRFLQRGDDVYAKIQLAKYAYPSEDQYLGMDFISHGANSIPTNVLYAAGWGFPDVKIKALGELGCTLKSGAAPLAPSEIVLQSSDPEACAVEEFVTPSYLTASEMQISSGLNLLDDIESIEAELNLGNFKSGAWVTAGGYCLTNTGTTVKANLVAKEGTRRVAVNLVFSQLASEIFVQGIWAGHSYDGKDVGAPIGYGVVGVALGLTNEAKTASIAVRNLKVRFRPTRRIVGDYADCILKDSAWVKIWPGVNLGETFRGKAWMGGESLYSRWNACTNAFWSLQENGTYLSAYQYLKSSELYTVGVIMDQQDEGVWAKINNARYAYNMPMGTPAWDDYSVTVTNVVDGKSPETQRTVALCHLTAEREVHRRHTMTVGNDFTTQFVPVRLLDIKLALAPTAETEMTYSTATSGDGAIGIAGAGKTVLGVDLPALVGLEVDSGTLVLTEDRVAAKGAEVAAGAAVEFRLTETVRPKLTTAKFTLAAGSQVVLSSATQLFRRKGVDKTTIKLVTGCDLSSLDLSNVTCVTAGALDNCKATLAVDAEGDLVATLDPIRGLTLILK